MDAHWDSRREEIFSTFSSCKHPRPSHNQLKALIRIWLWEICYERKILISADHLPGKKGVWRDQLSQQCQTQTNSIFIAHAEPWRLNMIKTVKTSRHNQSRRGCTRKGLHRISYRHQSLIGGEELAPACSIGFFLQIARIITLFWTTSRLHFLVKRSAYNSTGVKRLPLY